MGTAEVIKYLDDNQFGKKSYRELSAKSNKSVSLLLSDKTEAYDFDDITKYIFPKYTPSSADAILIKTNKIILIEFKGGFERKISEDNFDREKCRCEKINDVCEDYASLLKSNLKNIRKELTANLLKKAAESRWTLEHHLLPEVYKDNLYPDFQVNYIIVMDKVKENPVDAMEQIMDESDNTEIDIERSACEDYLDLYATELIYCLEQIADKVDRTVVFEDMDRLNQKDCIEIFSRLREINYMLNQRLSGDKYIRFIYVIKDEVLNELQHAKFFDYILPIVPGMNERSSEDIFRENLKKVNQRFRKLYEKELVDSVLRYAERAGARSLVHMAAPYIKDYRIQYAILNDYSLFFELNGAKRLKTSAFVNMAEQILALAIYKNIWPKHYDKVTSGESPDFFYTEITESKELAELLVDPEHPFLLYENLCYLGYSREKLIYNIINYIKDEEPFYSKSDVISSFPSDEFHIAAVHEFAENEVPKEETRHNIDEIVRLLTAITRYYIRSNTVDMSNILEKRDIHLCLRTLAALSEGEWKKYINNVKKELRWHWDSENRNTFNIFKNCLNIEFVATRTDWTEKEIEIFVYGTNDTEKYKGIHLHAKNSDGKPIVIDLEESIRQRNIQKVIPNIMV